MKKFLALSISDCCIYHANKCLNANNCWHFNIYKQYKFRAQLSLAWKSFITSRPGQTLQNAVSDQGLYCLLTECLIKIWGKKRKKKKHPTTLKTGIDWSKWYSWEIPKSVARTLKKLRTSKGDYLVKQWLSSVVPLFKMGNFSSRKEFAPRGSKFFPLRAVPYGMENQFYHVMWSPLNVTIFITQVRSNANDSIKGFTNLWCHCLWG